MASEYVNLKLGRNLVNLIDAILESGDLGYRTRAEFVSDAVRHHVAWTQHVMRGAATRDPDILARLESKGLSP